MKYSMTKASEVEEQFARQFVSTDWKLFKHMADAHLSEAAHLRRRDMRRSAVSSLLARNVRKRLLIGLGVELALKAAFLKAGYAINLPRKGSKLRFPFAIDDINGEHLLGKTVTFSECLKHLKVAVSLRDEPIATLGLEIAQVFRNKEAHSVVEAHAFDPGTYTAVEDSLRCLYADAFAEDLKVKIAMTKHDKPTWKIGRASHGR